MRYNSAVNREIIYYSDSVQEEILAMPAGFLGRYLRYTERMEVYGADLGMPHARALGEGLFELRLKAAEGNCTGVLLHAGQQKDCDTAPVHKESRQNSAPESLK